MKYKSLFWCPRSTRKPGLRATRGTILNDYCNGCSFGRKSTTQLSSTNTNGYRPAGISISCPNKAAGISNGVANSNQAAPNMLRIVPDTILITGKEAIIAPLSINISFAKAHPSVCDARVWRFFSKMLKWYLSLPPSSKCVRTQILGVTCFLFCPIVGGVCKRVMVFVFLVRQKCRCFF